MAIRYDEFGIVGVVTLDGDLRGDETVDEFRQVAGAAFQEERITAIVVDFTAARFVDGRGLAALLWMRGRLGSGVGAVRLCGLDANCRHIIEMTHLDGRFDLYDDVRAALRSTH